MGGGKLNKLIYASGVPVKVGQTEIHAFGIMWFLVVLFFSRTIFDYFHLKLGDSKKLIFAVVICSVIGVVIGQIQWLPFNLDIAFAIMPFMWFGNFMKKIDIKEKAILRFLISVLVFCVLLVVEFLICNTYLEIACRHYPIFPVSFVIATAGTLTVSYFSQILERAKIFKWLDFLGRNSFLIFAVHSIDYFYEFAWKLTESNIANGFIRCSEAVVLMIVIYFCKKMINEQRKKHFEYKI